MDLLTVVVGALEVLPGVLLGAGGTDVEGGIFDLSGVDKSITCFIDKTHLLLLIYRQNRIHITWYYRLLKISEV